MSYRSPFIRFVFALCAFAVLGAQVFGVTSRFVCDCSGSQVVVKESSCCGPHGAECHSDEAQPCEGDEKQHELEKETLTGTSAPTSHIVVPAAVVLAILPELSFFSPELFAAPAGYLSDAHCYPPLSVALARTVALRI